MWMLVKDHLRRNWKQLSLILVMFLCMLNLHGPEAISIWANGRKFDWLQYCVYALLACATASHGDPKIVRIWRTLPFRESMLANLAWGMEVLAPPVFFFVIALLVEFMALCFGSADSQSFTWPFVFLLLATLATGLYTFASASLRREYARAKATRRTRRTLPFLTSYNAKTIYLLVCVGIPILLILYPTPTRWSGLGLSHYAGMCLAAGLTWNSYRLRFWLLQPATGKNDSTQHSPSRESAPIHRGTVLAALAQDLRSTAQEAGLTLLFFAGLGYLIPLGLTWGGLLEQIDWSKDASSLIALICVFVGIKSVIDALSRISMLGVVRTLPLTGNQCVLLLLGYPYAVSLALIPCAAIPLWLAGQGHLPMLILAGILLCAGLCPFGMYILARFGRSALRSIIAVGLFLGIPGAFMLLQAFDQRLTPASTPVLYAVALILAVLGAVGYYGLRRVVESNSEVYKRKIEPE